MITLYQEVTGECLGLACGWASCGQSVDMDYPAERSKDTRRQHRTHRRSQRGDESPEIISNPDKVFMGFFNSTEISSLVSDAPLKQGHVVSDSVLTQGQFGVSVYIVIPTSCCHTFCFCCPYRGSQRLRDLSRVKEPVSD